MGWSCSTAAHATLDRWTRAEKQGFEGCAIIDGEHYFAEWSRREYRDGAITGKIVRILPGTRKPDGSAKGVDVGTFRVNGDGTVGRAPAFMRAHSHTGRAMTFEEAERYATEHEGVCGAISRTDGTILRIGDIVFVRTAPWAPRRSAQILTLYGEGYRPVVVRFSGGFGVDNVNADDCRMTGEGH